MLVEQVEKLERTTPQLGRQGVSSRLRSVVAAPALASADRAPVMDARSLGDALALAAALAVSLALVAETGRSSVVLFAAFCFAYLCFPTMRPHRMSQSALDDMSRLWRVVATCFLLTSLVAVAIGRANQQGLLLAATVSFLLLLVGRAISYLLIARLRTTAQLPCVLIGGGEVSRRLVSMLGEDKSYGMKVVGAVDAAPRFSEQQLGTKVLGTPDDLPRLVAERGIKSVIVTFSLVEDSESIDLIRRIMDAGATVWVVPRFFELALTEGDRSDRVRDVPLVRLPSPAPARWNWSVKRVVDVVGAAMVLTLAAPLMLAVAVAVRLDSRGPILLRQKRIGRDGRIFEMFKFRSMTHRDTGRVEIRPDEGEITRVGRVLRVTSLDELPQLFNVLKGEMSLVGPRPEEPFFVERFNDMFGHYGLRGRLPAGMTGWAQIHGLRGDRSPDQIDERARLDNFYIENWSLAGDMKILFRTLATMVKK